MALIMDDNEDVWRGPQQRQLLLVKPYQFFSNAKEVNNAPGTGASFMPRVLTKDELGISLKDRGEMKEDFFERENVEVSHVSSVEAFPTIDPKMEDDDQLQQCLTVVKKIHQRQFPSSSGDVATSKEMNDISSVSTVLDDIVNLKKSVLSGCAISFSGVIPTNQPVECHSLYQAAISLGAEVCRDAVIRPETR